MIPAHAPDDLLNVSIFVPFCGLECCKDLAANATHPGIASSAFGFAALWCWCFFRSNSFCNGSRLNRLNGRVHITIVVVVVLCWKQSDFIGLPLSSSQPAPHGSFGRMLLQCGGAAGHGHVKGRHSRQQLLGLLLFQRTPDAFRRQFGRPTSLGGSDRILEAFAEPFALSTRSVGRHDAFILLS